MSSRDSGGLRIAVTGAAGAIGARLVGRLAAWDAVEEVLALDLRPLSRERPRVTSLAHDVTRPVGGLLRAHRVRTVVHLAFHLRPGRDREAVRRVNVGGTESVLKGCAEAGVRHVLYLGSTTVYGAHRDTPPLLTEESPLRPVRGFQYAEDKVAAEGLLEGHRARNPECRVTVLRGCVVMGPGMDNFITSALARPVLVGVLGHDPPMQFLHVDDLMEAMLHLLAMPVSGVFNVAGEGTVRYSELARMGGRRLLWLPAPLLYAITQATWALRIQDDSPACGLEMVRWPWLASTERLRRYTGLRPRHTSAEALRSYLGPRPAPAA